MNRYQSLYKDNSVLSPRQHNGLRREYVKKSRAQMRNDKFNSNRIISVSPTPKKPSNIKLITNCAATSANNDKENIKTEIETNKDSLEITTTTKLEELPTEINSRIAKVACTTTNDKLSRQELYLKRFAEYRENKKKLTQQQQHKRKVLQPTATANRNVPVKSQVTTAKQPQQLATAASQLNLNKNVSKPVEGNQATNSKNGTSNGTKRRSVYVPTAAPKKDNPASKPANNQTTKFTTTKNIWINAACKPLTTVKTAATMTRSKAIDINATAPKQLTKSTPFQDIGTSVAKTIPDITTTVGIKKALVNKAAPKPLAPTHTNATPKPLATVNPTLATNKLAAAPKMTAIGKPKETHTNVKVTKTATATAPKPLAAVIPSTVTNKVFSVPKNTVSGASGKLRDMKTRRDVAQKSNPHKNANLSINMKSKKPFAKPSATNKGSTFGNGLKCTTNVLAAKKEKIQLALQKEVELVAMTPTDFNCVNRFDHFITSTQVKDAAQHDINMIETEISPVEFNDTKDDKPPTKRTLSTAKRALQPISTNETKQPEKEIDTKRKYNFVRYSEGLSAIDTILSPENKTPSPEVTMIAQKQTHSNGNLDKTSEQNNEDNLTLVNKDNDDGLNTPKQQGAAERPANYLSPFVSVSRGKVSTRVERERRNSIYLQNADENDTPKRAPDVAPATAVTPIAVRRTLEGVRYFRKQLAEETERLLVKCKEWETYKNENLERLQETHCEDKIDAAIGQTRLLASNKFEQFNGLIKRCEACATGINKQNEDGSEDTKPVTAEDLEGFWAMLSLQCSNVDKRFAEIELWKNNDWQDPAAKCEKPKKKNAQLTKVMKAKAPSAGAGKAKGSSGLQELMRKLRKQKLAAGNTSLSKNTSTGDTESTKVTRQSKGLVPVIVPNRKRFSQAATILNLTASPISNSRRSTLSKPSPKNSEAFSSNNPAQDLLKSAIRGAANKANSHESGPLQSPKPRKSILKTPGTVKSQRKSVVFSAKKQIRKFKFTFEEKLDDDDDEKLVGSKNESLSGIHHLEDGEADMTPDNISNGNSFNKSEESSMTADGKRTYGLRSRRVVLRPSCEIIIPRSSN